MKTSLRLATLAITAVALTGTLGAQARRNGHDNGRVAQPRGHAEARGHQDARPQHYAQARGDVRGGRDVYRGREQARARADLPARVDVRARVDARARIDDRGRAEYRGRMGNRPPVAEHGRPLITRAGYRAPFYGGGFRYYHGISRLGLRVVLPFGWERPLFVRGYFPVAYAGYCEDVPPELDYMLPPMRDSYDPCLIGDRVVVYDRFSHGIVFAAVIP